MRETAYPDRATDAVLGFFVLAKMRPFVTLILILTIAGCQLPSNGPLEQSVPPQISQTSLSPSLIEVNKISSHFNPIDPVDTVINVSAWVTDEDGFEDISTGQVSLFSPEGSPLDATALSVSAGSPSMDGKVSVLTGGLRLTAIKRDLGTYTIHIQASDRSNQRSNIIIRKLVMENSANNPPTVSPQIVPDSSIIPTGQDSIIVRLEMLVADPQGYGDIASVSGSFLLLDGSSYLDFSLFDDGGVGTRPPFNISSGDSAASDGKFGIRLVLKKSDVGNYILKVLAKDVAEATSNVFNRAIYVRNAANHPPSIANPVVPDTVFVPSGAGTNLVKVTIAASDPEGLQDIASVTFTSQRPDGSIVDTYPMFDDGSEFARPPFNIPSGDAVVGDGSYSLTIPLASTTERNTYRDFIFQAKDRAGEKSSTITKRIYIQ